MSFAWFPYSLGSIVLFGVGIALYKLPSMKGESSLAASFWQMVVYTVFSLILFHQYLGLTDGPAIFWGAVWGIGFAVYSLLQIYAMNHVDASSLFPVTSSASLIVTVFYGLLFLGNQVSFIQLCGVLLTICTVYLFAYKDGTLQYSKIAAWLGFAIIFLSAFNKIIQKSGVDRVDIHTFQIYYSLFALVATFVMLALYEKTNLKRKILTGVRSGVYSGVPLFFGGWLILIALSKGPFTLITALHSFYTVITALVAWMFLGEKLTKRKVFLIGLAIVAVLLIRLG